MVEFLAGAAVLGFGVMIGFSMAQSMIQKTLSAKEGDGSP